MEHFKALKRVDFELTGSFETLIVPFFKLSARFLLFTCLASCDREF
jgi:hypothetical protein